MAFAIEYPTHVLGPYKEGRKVTLYVPECRQIIAIPNGVEILDGRGRKIYSRQAGSEAIELASDTTIYPLAEGAQAPKKDSFPELD